MTTSTHDADFKGNNFRRTIHPQSCSFDNLGAKERWRGGGGGWGLLERPQSQPVKNKRGLDRANLHVIFPLPFDILNIKGHKLVAREKDIHPIPSCPRPAR